MHGRERFRERSLGMCSFVGSLEGAERKKRTIDKLVLKKLFR